MERAEIIACRANGEDIFFEFSSNSQLDKKCLAFRGSLHSASVVKDKGLFQSKI